MKKTIIIIGIYSFLLFNQCLSKDTIEEGTCASPRTVPWNKEKVVFVDCHHNKLSFVPTFPSNLLNKIEALDLSYNNIKKIKNDTFSKYTRLKVLNIGNNNIHKFESDALRPLSNLIQLDLNSSTNVNISSIYLPPTLRTLILDGVLSITSDSKLPFAALQELTLLTLNSCDLENLPSFDGTIHSLTVLELENNELNNFKTADISMFCQLKRLSISRDSVFSKSCECRSLEKWATDHDFATRQFCSSQASFKECGDPSLNFSLNGYDSCIKMVETTKLRSQMLTGSLVLVIVIFIVLVIVALYLCKCRGKKLNVVRV